MAVGPEVTFEQARALEAERGTGGKAPVHRWYEGNKVGSDDFRMEMKLIKSFDLNGLFD
jgi:hypothetical protein